MKSHAERAIAEILEGDRDRWGDLIDSDYVEVELAGYRADKSLPVPQRTEGGPFERGDERAEGYATQSTTAGRRTGIL